MAKMTPEPGRIPGLTAAEAYPQDLEGYDGTKKPTITELVAELAGSSNKQIAETLVDHVDAGRLTRSDADSVIDQIAIRRAQQEFQNN